MRHFLAIVMIGLLVAGCGRSGPPAPVVYGGSGGKAAASAPSAQGSSSYTGSAVQRQASSGRGSAERPGTSAARPSGAGIHTAQRGDSVYGVARRYGVPIRALIEENGLQPPYRLTLGQRLRIPIARTHEVNRGETLYSISRRYGIDMRELARVNDLQPPYTIVVGQTLQISSGSAQTAVTRTQRSQRRAETGSTRTSEPPAREETRSAGRPTQQAARTSRDVTAPPVPGRKPPAPARARTRTASAPPATTPSEIPQPAPRASSRFLWPVEGEVIQRFGAQGGGLHNDGVNIAAPRGTAVKAADNGVVAYVGNELRGFGTLLLIKHAENWVTAYAHVQEVTVERGAQVKRGQVVARVGNSGSVSRPQLHFEVRRGTKAVDPLKETGRMTAALTE